MTNKIQSIISSALVFGALAIGVVTSPARAMAQKIPLASADIPFSFHVGSKVMPAGTYIFSHEQLSLLMLRNNATGRSTFTLVMTNVKKRPQKDGAIVFARYGNEYFLRNVDVPYTTSTYQCRDNKAEQEVSRAMHTTNPTQVAVNTAPTLSR